MSNRVSPRLILTDPINLLAFGFGSGLSSKAPGTVGTLACIPFYFLLFELPLEYYLGVCILVSLLGIYICGYAAESLKTHDHPGIVWDEFAGFLITMIAVPFTWSNLLLGFLLFRAFDILKPWPINWLDKKVSGGFGIMVDDIIAGVFSLACLHTLNYLM